MSEGSVAYILGRDVNLVYDLHTTGDCITILIAAPVLLEAVNEINGSDSRLYSWMNLVPPEFEQISLNKGTGTFGFNSCGRYAKREGRYALALEFEIPPGPLSPEWAGIHAFNSLSSVFYALRFMESQSPAEGYQACCIDCFGIISGQGGSRGGIAFGVSTSHRFARWVATSPDCSVALSRMQACLGHIRKKALTRSERKDCQILATSGQLIIIHSLFDGTGSIGTIGGAWERYDQESCPTGFELIPHNLDTVEQGMVVLVGLAALWQQFRENGSGAGL